jgi:hypothetical protein
VQKSHDLGGRAFEGWMRRAEKLGPARECGPKIPALTRPAATLRLGDGVRTRSIGSKTAMLDLRSELSSYKRQTISL